MFRVGTQRCLSLYLHLIGYLVSAACFLAVIGFNPNNLTIDEEVDPAKKQLRVELLSTETGLADSVKNGLLDVTVQVNSTASTAKLGRLHAHPKVCINCLMCLNLLGVDFKFNDGDQNTTRFEKPLLQLIGRPEGIPVQAINDNDTGEIEHFVVEMIRAEVRDQEEGQTIQVFAGNSMTVNITDDDSKCSSILPLVLSLYFLPVYFSHSRWV